jgi:hypothetical protein
MSAAVRLQLSRVKGFDLQAHSLATNGLPAVNVARPGRFGNPFSVQQAADIHDCRSESAHHYAVGWFEEWITTPLTAEAHQPMHEWDGYQKQHARITAGLAELRGKNLACFCKPGLACHADVLLRLANPVCEALPPLPTAEVGR